MKSFPLLPLQPHLFVKVINKLNSKSYARIQQTCRIIGQLIRKYGNISVIMDGKYSIWALEDNRQPDRIIGYAVGKDNLKCDIFSLYGTRLNRLCVEGLRNAKFCNILKKNRITCSLLDQSQTLSKKDCVIVAKTLKPTTVRVCGITADDEENRNEEIDAVIDAGIKGIAIHMEGDGIPIKMFKRILPLFKEITIYQIYHDDFQLNQAGNIVKMLTARFLPNLYSFTYYGSCSAAQGQITGVPVDIKLSDDFPDESFCQLTVGDIIGEYETDKYYKISFSRWHD